MGKVGLSCPVNTKQVNEIVIRLVAGQVVFLATSALFFQNQYLAFILVADFGFRAFGLSTYSPLKYIAQKTVTHFQLGFKATNEAPKKFAATIGFFVVVLFALLLFFKYALSASIIGGFLLLFASLESIFGICVGCIFYQLLARYKLI